MPSRMMEVHDATAAGIPVYFVTWHRSVVEVGIATKVPDADCSAMLDTIGVVEVVTIGVGDANTVLLATGVGIPPSRQVHALEILAGTWDHWAANGGTVWVGTFV